MNGVILCVQRDGCSQGLSRSSLRVTRLENVPNIPCWILIKEISGKTCLHTVGSISLSPQTIFCLHVTGLKSQTWGLALSWAIYDKKKKELCLMTLKIFDHFRHWQCSCLRGLWLAHMVIWVKQLKLLPLFTS